MRSDLSNRSSNYICTLLITHRFTNNTIFWCHSSFELYFYALEFLLNFFLHLIFGSFVHCHTHIVHICNYFPSIDVNKNHSIKQNKKKIYSHLKCLSFLGECFLSCLDIVRYSPVCVSSFFAIWFTSTLLLIQKQNIQLALFSLIPFSWEFKNDFFNKSSLVLNVIDFIENFLCFFG